MRLEEESTVVREAYPAEYADLAVAVTELGGTSFLMLCLALCFWLTRRRESALVASYAFAGYALVLGVRALLGVPRPPEDLLLVALEVDEHAFPSGHAVAAVVVYGGLYRAFEPTRKRLALLAVAVLVAAISLSRVVLGVHYLGDVLAGLAVGVGFLFAMERLTDGDPRRGFAAAVVFALPTLAILGVTQDSLLALGGAVGGLLGSTRLEALPALRSRLEGAVLAVAGVGFVFAIRAAESVVFGLGFPPAAVALYGLLMAGILLAPDAIGRLPLDRVEIGSSSSA